MAVDDYTRRNFIAVIDSKAEALPAFKKLKMWLEKQKYPLKIAITRTDAENVYIGERFSKFLEGEGIAMEHSSRYKHGRNGVAERMIGTVGSAGRAMMLHGNAPEREFPHAILHAGFARNNSPTSANSPPLRTPMERWEGVSLSTSQRLLKAPLFCLVFPHVYEGERLKHGNRGLPCLYLGVDEAKTHYKCRNLSNGKLTLTDDMTVHPRTYPCRDMVVERPIRLYSEIEGKKHDDHAPVYIPQLPITETKDNDDQEATSDNEGKHQHDDDASGTRRSTRGSQPSAQALRNIASLVVTLNPRKEHAYISVKKKKPHKTNHLAEAMFGPDPKTLKEALNGKYAKAWKKATFTELDALEKLGVYKLVPRPKNKRVFGNKPVLKTKMHPPDDDHPRGSLDKRKVRITIQAFTKMLKEGIDYKEKYASTVRWNSIKILLAKAADEDLELTLIDVCTFFLYGDLEEIIHMEQVVGFEVEGKEDWVWLLLKSLYGLPQAPLCAQKKLKHNLTSDGKFKATTADDCVYTLIKQGKNDKAEAVLGAHVDDIPTVGNKEGTQRLIKQLKKDFAIKVTEEPNVIMGVQIQRNRKHKWLKIHQEDYVNKILKKWKMDECHPTKQPLDPGVLKYDLDEEIQPEYDEDESRAKYQEMVGELIWLLKTRPDLQFPVNLLSRFLRKPRKTQFNWVNSIHRYLAGTRDYGIVFQAGYDPVLLASSDADLAGDRLTSKSTYGHGLKYGRYGTICCKSKLQKKNTSDSTGMAETYAVHETLKEIQWTRLLLEEIGLPQHGHTVVDVDNAGVVKQSKKMINHAGAKHYRIAQAVIRELCYGPEQIAELDLVPSKLNSSDIFTKPLGGKLFRRHRLAVMGPQDKPID